MLTKFIRSGATSFITWLDAHERASLVRREARRIEDELNQASDAALLDLGLTRWDIPTIARQTAEQYVAGERTLAAA